MWIKSKVDLAENKLGLENYNICVSGQLSNSSTNGVIRVRPLQQKETLKYIDMKCLPSLTTLRKPIINQTMYVFTFTGYGPVRSHLA